MPAKRYLSVKQSVKSTVKLILLLVVAIALLFVAFKDVDLEHLVTGFRTANYLWVAIAAVAAIAAHIVRALRWRLLMEPLGHKPSLTNTLGALMVGYMANLVFPRIGEVTRCGSLRKTDNIPFDSLIGTVIVERAFDLLVMLALTLVVFVIRVEFFGNFIWHSAIVPIGSKIQGLVTHAPFVLIASAIFLVALVVLIRKNVFGQKFHDKLSSFFWGLIDGVKSVFTMKRRGTFFLYTSLLWFFYWIMTWLMVFSIDATSTLGPIDGLFLLVVGSFGMAAPVQGGFGAYHIITAMALGIYGISREDGLLYAVISHESQTLLFIIMGLAFLVYFFFKFRKKESALGSSTSAS